MILLKKKILDLLLRDVIDIVPSKDHKQIRYIEIISVLTKIVKEQDKDKPLENA